MAKFGLNPYQENLFRIVFSNSRTHLVVGDWQSTHINQLGQVELNVDDFGRQIKTGTYALECMLYQNKRDLWVLERWLPPQEFCGCTQEVWDWKYECLGPYPSRGDYQAVHFFEALPPARCNLEKLISWIEQGRKNSWQTVLDGTKAAYEYDKKEAKRQAYDKVYDSLSAHLDNAVSGPYRSRGTKTAHMPLTAEQAGMRANFKHAHTEDGLGIKFGVGKTKKRRKAVAA